MANTLVSELFRLAWRKWNTEGVPSSGEHEPDKDDIFIVGDTLQTQLNNLETLINGDVKWRADVRLATTTNGTLATSYENGDTVDSIVLATNDSILIKNNADGKVLGVYVVQASGAPVRRGDSDTGAELQYSAYLVRQGTSAGLTYICSNETVPTIGVDNITFAIKQQQNTAIPGALDALQAQGADKATASTVDLSTATGNVVRLTGTTTVTNFGTMTAGIRRTIIAASKFKIAASTKILTPGGYDITLSANEVLDVVSRGSDIWEVVQNTGPVVVLDADLDDPGIRVDPTGIIIRPKMYVSSDGTAHFPQSDVVPSDQDYPDTYVDPTGIRIRTRAEIMIANGSGGGGSGGGWGDAYWTAQDAEGAAYAARVAARPIPYVSHFSWPYNLLFGFGQSRSVGANSTPPKTTSPPAWGITAKSVGTSVGASDESNAFRPFGAIGDPSIGAFNLQPLIATVDQDDPGGGRREDPVTFVGEVTNGLGGERTLVGLTYSLFKQWNETRGELTGNYLNRIPIAASHGFGGQNLSDLLGTGNIPSHPFSTRLRAMDYCSDLKTYVQGTLASTIGMTITTFWQGEADSSSTSYEDYYDLLEELLAWLYTDLAVGIFGQSAMPILIITQVMEHWVVEKPTIPQAHHDFTLANETVFISAPSHATPGKMEVPADGVSMPTVLNEHKGGNEGRWHGEYDAKVAHQVLVLRRYWEHMHIVAGAWKAGDNQVILTWHTPVGPIAIRECFTGYRRTMLSDWGITVKQNGSEIGIVSKQIYGTNSVLLTIDGILITGLPVTAEIGIASGRANIWDSDPAVGRFNYIPNIRDYASDTAVPGDMTAQEIAIQAEVDDELGYLYNKPYPLFNAAVGEVFTLREILE